MPAVNLNPELFQALKEAADRRGQALDDALASAVREYLRSGKMTDEEYGTAWDRLRKDIQSHMPPDVTDEEIQRDIDAAVAEVRAERLARGN